VWQKIVDACLIVIAKNNQKFCTGKGIDFFAQERA